MAQPRSRMAKTIAEALAAIGVIASLLFVGVELQQNNAQARATAFQTIGVATAELMNSWAHDPQFVEIGLKAPSEMTPEDWTQYRYKFTAFARLGEMILLQIEQGVLEPDAIERLGFAGWKRMYQDAKIPCVWPQIRVGVSDVFRDWVEEGQTPGSTDCSNFALP